MRESRTLTWSGEITDEEHTRRRDAGLLLCRCPGHVTRDPAFVWQCRRCWRRVHRRHDNELVT